MEESYDAFNISKSWRDKHNQESWRQARCQQHLENLGFVVGGDVTIVNSLAGNVIVSVKDTRVALSQEMAQKIMV